MPDLTDKVILVTGASRGIGKEIARELAERGAHVIAQYNSSSRGAEEAVSSAPADRKLLVAADFSNPSAASELWNAAIQWRGRIDAIVCNAAIMPSVELDAPDSEWNDTWAKAMQVNVIAPADLTRRAVGHFISRGEGVVVGLSSWSAQRGSSNPNLSAYSASKAAYAAMVKTLARAHAKDGVLAYLIAPGVVQTEMSVLAAADNGGTDAVTSGLAMREWVPPHEIASLVGVLCEGKLRHLTGATLDMNGASYIR